MFSELKINLKEYEKKMGRSIQNRKFINFLINGGNVGTRICKNMKYERVEQEKFLNLVFDRKFDVTNIKISKNQSVIVKDNDGNEIVLQYTKTLGEGSYGEVQLFSDGIRDLAVKFEIDEFSKEQEIADELYGKMCNAVEVRYIESVYKMKKNKEGKYHTKYILTPMNGDLHDLNKRIRNLSLDISKVREIKHQIAREIQKQVKCLFETNNKYVYTDMKLSNILYKCNRSLSNFKVHIGDLGSAVSDLDNEYLSTYPPFEYRNKYDPSFNELKTNKEKRQVLAWSMGIFLLQLMSTFESERIMIYLTRDRIKFLTYDENSQKYFISRRPLNLEEIMKDYYGISGLSGFLSGNPESRLAYDSPIPSSPIKIKNTQKRKNKTKYVKSKKSKFDATIRKFDPSGSRKPKTKKELQRDIKKAKLGMATVKSLRGGARKSEEQKRKRKNPKGAVNFTSKTVKVENFNEDIQELTKQKNDIEEKIEAMKEKYGYWADPIKGNIIGPCFISLYNINGKKICLFGEHHYYVSQNKNTIRKLQDRLWFHTILNRLWNKSVSANKCLDFYFEKNYTSEEKEKYIRIKKKMQNFLLNRIKFKDSDGKWNDDFEIYPKLNFQSIFENTPEIGSDYDRSIDKRYKSDELYTKEYDNSLKFWSNGYLNVLRTQVAQIRKNMTNNIRIHYFDLREYFGTREYFNPFLFFYLSDCITMKGFELIITKIENDYLSDPIILETPQEISINVLEEFAKKQKQRLQKARLQTIENINFQKTQDKPKIQRHLTLETIKTKLFVGTPYNTKQDLKNWIIFYCGNFNNSINDQLYLDNMDIFFKTLYELDNKTTIDCEYNNYETSEDVTKCKLINQNDRKYFSIKQFKIIRNFVIKMFQKSSFKDNPLLFEKCIDNLVNHMWDTKNLTNKVNFIFVLSILYNFIFTDVYAFLRMFISWDNDETSKLSWDNFIEGCRVNLQSNIIHYGGSEHSHNLNALLKGVAEPIFFKEVDDDSFITIDNDLYLF